MSVPQRLPALDRELDKLQSPAGQNRRFFHSFALPEDVEAVQFVDHIAAQQRKGQRKDPGYLEPSRDY